MALTWKWFYISIFTTNYFRVRRAKREIEREKEERVTDPPNRTPAPALPYISHHHRDRITIEDRSTQTDRTPPKTNPPRSIAPRPIHQRSHHPDRSHPIEIASPPKTDPPKSDLISAVVTHDRSRRPLVVTYDPWPISPFPSIFDLSLFLPLSVWPNGGV